MRNAPDSDTFELDIQLKVSDLLASESMKIVHRHSMTSESKAAPAILSFWHKCAPYWSILKWKAHLCPYSGKQIQGINFLGTI
jgi:hypothetical protein